MTVSTTLDIEAIFTAYSAAWEARDADAIASLHTEDTQFWLHMGEQPVIGRDAVRDHFIGIFATYPNLGSVTHRTIFGHRHWVFDWAMTSTITDSTGQDQTVSWDCLDLVLIDDAGLVTRKDTYADYLQALAALEQT